MKLLEKIKRKFTRQTTFCYCPKCQKELISARGTTMEETHYVKSVETEPGVWGNEVDDTLYVMTCPKCKHRSTWLFDTPVPVLVDGVFEEYGDGDEDE